MSPDLSTSYLGLTLRNPLVVASSPLSDDLDNLKKMEDAGAGAVVLHSLFEEQLRHERLELHHHLTQSTYSFPEALSFFPEPEEFSLGPEELLEHIRRAKQAVRIPVIASLNGISPGNWTKCSRQMQEAGADAIELNIYYIPTDPELDSARVEQTYLDILQAVKSAVTVPVAVKISPFFSNMAAMARRLDAAGADALVLFNRFYQPDIDLEAVEVRPHVLLSTPQAMRLPMRWIAILHGHLRADLAAASGVHQALDVVKMLMVGANVVQICSALLMRGIDHLRVIEQGLRAWMEVREYASVREMRGSLSQEKCPDPAVFERAQYMRALASLKPV
ncbi:MAG: dihydroorotate dehydrogenase-like protein [Verrucomicrobiae bacterium]|nr:dihydroorotate dehydrogenase-like protein [Verrucomicrobiae bacterium]